MAWTKLELFIQLRNYLDSSKTTRTELKTIRTELKAVRIELKPVWTELKHSEHYLDTIWTIIKLSEQN